MAEITNQLLFEMLKQIQEDIAQMKSVQADHTRQFIRIREDINSLRDDVNNLRGDDLRRETMQIEMDSRLQRIETRLNLSDA